MLLLARSDATDWPLAVSDFYFDELVDDVVRAMTLMASAKGVALEAQCPTELQVHGDEALLQQMLVNLLENAVRHTPAGGQVQLTVTAGEGRVTVSLRDTGSGIPEAERDRVFDRFVQLTAPGARRSVASTGPASASRSRGASPAPTAETSRWYRPEPRGRNSWPRWRLCCRLPFLRSPPSRFPES